MNFASRRNQLAILLTIGCVAWCSLALAGLLRSNPFMVATTTAAAHGGWAVEEVRFDRGQYQFLGLFSTVEAYVTASTATSQTGARIRLTHVPFRGWETTAFEVLPRGF